LVVDAAGQGSCDRRARRWSGSTPSGSARTSAPGSDFKNAYSFFFPDYFEPVVDPADDRFQGLDSRVVRSVAERFSAGYQTHDGAEGVVSARFARPRWPSGWLVGQGVQGGS
jgi:hypothetical protein